MRSTRSLPLLIALLVACRGGSDEGSLEAADSDTAGSTVDESSGDEIGDSGDTDGTDTANPNCGNGVIDEGEECDDGADNGPVFGCLADCTLNVCGDGFLGPEEGCDDSNLVDGDGCSATCSLESVPEGVLLCEGKIYECGDTMDNDGDSLFDLDDPECISPCDDDESSFKTNLPGQNVDCKQDCYFDSDSGAGNDKCEWNLKCDPENPGAETGCPYDPDFAMCNLEMPEQCLDVCVPLVPNGCDCFGCCEVEGQFVYLDSGVGCALDDLASCESCTFFEGCNNPCDPVACELCFGQSAEDLPPECEMPTCPEGVDWCFTEADCAEDEFCQTGCCLPLGS